MKLLSLLCMFLGALFHSASLAVAADESTPVGPKDGALNLTLPTPRDPIILFDAQKSKAKPKLYFYDKFPTEKFKDTPLLLDALSASGQAAKKLGQKITPAAADVETRAPDTGSAESSDQKSTEE